MLAILLPLAVLLGTTSANCAYGTSLFPRLAQVPVSTFSYDALSGPLNWYGLNGTANYACDNGTQQSPIVIDGSISVVPGSSITTFAAVDYPDGARFENLGTDVEVVVNGTLVDSNSGTAYSLAQFHFHMPAEHRINDEFYPIEMHWVFESAGPLNFSELEQKFLSNDVSRFSGSLTTPPCSEQLNWLISTNILSIDLPTWLTVKKVIKYNARYTQDVLGNVNLLQNAAQELGASCGTK